MELKRFYFHMTIYTTTVKPVQADIHGSKKSLR